MSDAQGLESLTDWFASGPFRVRDMPEERIEELAKLVGISAANLKGLRPKVGQWLNSMDRRECLLGTGRTAVLNVLEPAVGSKPGLYRVQSFSR